MSTYRSNEGYELKDFKLLGYAEVIARGGQDLVVHNFCRCGVCPLVVKNIVRRHEKKRQNRTI